MATSVGSLATASVEAALTEAVRASLGLPSEEWPAFIASHLLAQLEGAPLPAAAPRDASRTKMVQHEMPALAALLSKAVNEAVKSASGGEPLRVIAANLMSVPAAAAAAPPSDAEAGAPGPSSSAAAAESPSSAAAAALAPSPSDATAAAVAAPGPSSAAAAGPAGAPVPSTVLERELANLAAAGIPAAASSARDAVKGLYQKEGGVWAAAPSPAPAAVDEEPPPDAPDEVVELEVDVGSGMLWMCRCKQVQIILKNKPLYDIDCHLPENLPVASYVDHKSDGKPPKEKGISSICASGLGVAKSFYMLEDVKFYCGREFLKPLKRGPTGTGSDNVRYYVSCCNTLCVMDSGKAMPEPWRSFNRNCIRTADGKRYKPEGVTNGNAKDNEKWEAIPSPKTSGLPEGVSDLLATLWSNQLEPPERDMHAGEWAPGGDDPNMFYRDADAVEEYAIALVGLEDALGEYMERERERARAEAEAARIAAEAEAARIAAEEEAARILAEKQALLDANPSQAAALSDKGLSFDEVYEALLKEHGGGDADADAAAAAAARPNGPQSTASLVNVLAQQMVADAGFVEDVNPELELVKAPQYDADAITKRAREIADQAFQRYDQDGNGTIDKEELFDMCLTVGQVAPSGAPDDAKREYLEKQWALADTNGDGTVDFEEFVEFYVCTLEALAAEEAARHAFNRYDVDGSNALEKHELFQALFELDMVPGHDNNAKRVYLEDQFAVADTNGDGLVDFAEFVAFYTSVLHDSRKSDIVFERRRKNQRAREERAKRALAYVQPEGILDAIASGSLVLLSGQWLLRRAGYTSNTIERRGIEKTTWTGGGPLTPLVPRATLESAEPSAYIKEKDVLASHAAYLELCEAGGKAFQSPAISALPVVLASHSWETPNHADPEGTSLAKIAANLARSMPTYNAWGFADVGVYFDFSCMYYELPGVPRSKEQEYQFIHAQKQLNVWFSHRMTTVYMVDDQPQRCDCGWQFFEEALMALFKEVPPSKPFKVKGGQLVPFWAKVVCLSNEDIKGDPSGVNPQAGALRKAPPLSAPHFIERLKGKRFDVPSNRELAIREYRAAVEDGFNSLDRLIFSRLDWSDEDVAELASAFEEVPCPNVVELDLSWNDMRAGSGLEAIGKAIALGALHSLQRLNLINCTAIKALPDSLEELLELNTILLDGCVQLRHLPDGMAKLASLKVLQIINCHAIDDADLKHLPSSTKIIRTKEEKTKFDELTAAS